MGTTNSEDSKERDELYHDDLTNIAWSDQESIYSPKITMDDDHKNDKINYKPRRPPIKHKKNNHHKKMDKMENEWEIISNLKDGMMFICSNETFSECMEIKLLGLPK